MALDELSRVSAVVRNPKLLLGEARKRGVEANVIFQNRREKQGVSVMDEDWDTLLILDACRYDMYVDADHPPGDVIRRQSLGSGSREFMMENFDGRTFHDTVYVSANPYSLELPDGTFHAHRSLLSEWDDGTETVRPEVVADAARETHTEFLHKRIIVHFMQPHYPFIGPAGEEIEHRGFRPDQETIARPSIWENLQFGRTDGLSERDVWEAYRENLDIVLGVVSGLLTDIEGRTVITADHGNHIGERTGPIPVKTYGHPEGLRTPELINVPWHIIESDNRREVIADSPIETDTSIDEETMRDRLESLGYR